MYVLLTASGLESFDREFGDGRDYDIDGIRVRVLPLERVLVSQTGRQPSEGPAQIPILEATLAARQNRRDP